MKLTLAERYMYLRIYYQTVMLSQTGVYFKYKIFGAQLLPP